MESITVLPDGSRVGPCFAGDRFCCARCYDSDLWPMTRSVLWPSLTFLLSFCLEEGICSRSISNPAVVGKRDGNEMDFSKSTPVSQGLAVLGFKKLRWLRAPESRLNTGAVLPVGGRAPSPSLWEAPQPGSSVSASPARVVSQFTSLPPAPGAEDRTAAESFLKMDCRPD